MPIYIRRLPVKQKHALMDPKNAANGCTFFNPSRAGSIVCVRITEVADGGRTQKNKALLFDTETQTSFIVEPPWSQLAPTINLYKGIEDVRLCWFDGRLWFSATTTHASAAMTSEIVVGYFSKDYRSVEVCALVDIGSRPVKNLCPFVADGRLCLWDAYKLRIYVLDTSAFLESKCSQIAIIETITMTFGEGIPTNPLRGSTSPIHLHGNTWGCVVHDIIFCDLPTPIGLSYIHYWMEFRLGSPTGSPTACGGSPTGSPTACGGSPTGSPTGQIVFLSQPFYLLHWGIEYISGIHTDLSCNNGASATTTPIRLYFGIDDKMPMECTTSLHDLRMGK